MLVEAVAVVSSLRSRSAASARSALWSDRVHAALVRARIQERMGWMPSSRADCAVSLPPMWRANSGSTERDTDRYGHPDTVAQSVEWAELQGRSCRGVFSAHPGVSVEAHTQHRSQSQPLARLESDSARQPNVFPLGLLKGGR
jgi:hypothetical protein